MERDGKGGPGARASAGTARAEAERLGRKRRLEDGASGRRGLEAQLDAERNWNGAEMLS